MKWLRKGKGLLISLFWLLIILEIINLINGQPFLSVIGSVTILLWAYFGSIVVGLIAWRLAEHFVHHRYQQSISLGTGLFLAFVVGLVCFEAWVGMGRWLLALNVFDIQTSWRVTPEQLADQRMYLGTFGLPGFCGAFVTFFARPFIREWRKL